MPADQRPDDPQQPGHARPFDREARLRARMAAHAPSDPAARDAHAREAFERLLQARERRELAERDIRRSIYLLADGGMSQRAIASAAGLSQAEVSRRLARRRGDDAERTPREVIMQRAAGEIDTARMLSELIEMSMTHRAPSKSAAFDNAATIRGAVKQVAAAFQEGLLSEAEYEQIRRGIGGRARIPRDGRTPRRRPSRSDDA